MNLTSTVKTRTLERLQVVVQSLVSREMNGAEIDTRKIDYIANGMMLEVRGYVWAEKKELDIDTSYEEPLSWWEMLKRDYAPNFFKERYPVRRRKYLRSIRVNFYKKYPEFKYETDRKFGCSIPFMEYERLK